MRLALIVPEMADGWASCNLNTDSMTVNSVDVVSMPQKAHQSFTTIPAATTSLPLFTVPACSYTNTYMLNIYENMISQSITYNKRHL